MKLKNKVALITGGSSGLGFATAKALIKKGCKVHILGRDPQKLKTAAARLNSNNLFTHQCDITNYLQLSQTLKQIKTLDILINNAGLWFEGPPEHHTQDKVDTVIDGNLKGAVYTASLTVPQFRKQNNGFIINISSSSGLVGKQNQMAYVAAKFGVQGLTEALKQDLKDTNVEVVGFYPGGMNTPFFDKSKDGINRSNWMDPHKVADIITFILQQDDTMLIDHIVISRRNK